MGFFMLYGFLLIYLRDFAPNAKEWAESYSIGKHFETRLAHVHGNLFAFLNILIGYLLIQFSNKLKHIKAISGLAKKIVVLFIPISISIYWIIVWADVSSITAWIFALLGIAEVYSIVWKIYEIKTGKKISEFDAMTAVIWFIGWKINSEIERMLTINNKK